MQRGFVTLFAVGAGLTLSGCQSFPIFRGAHARSSAPVAAQADIGRYIEQGRQQLDAGQTGTAIDTFRVALAVGEDPAAAVNGLGVAYTRLGRFDAAQALFAKAAQLDPANARYARNLARIESTRADLALAAADRLPTATAVLPAPRAEVRPGQVVRIASDEVSIHSAALPSRGNLAVVGVRSGQKGTSAAERNAAHPSEPAAPKALAIVDPRFKPLTRVALRAPSAAQSPANGRTFALASKPRVTISPAFVPLVRVEFMHPNASPSRSKVVVLAAR